MLADEFGNLDLLRPVQQAAVVIRHDGGRIGKAKSDVFKLVFQRFERIGQHGIKFGGRGFVVAAGHRLLAETRKPDFPLSIEPGRADTQVGAARIDYSHGLIGGNLPVAADVGRDHGQRAGLAIEALLHFVEEAGEQGIGIVGLCRYSVFFQPCKNIHGRTL